TKGGFIRGNQNHWSSNGKPVAEFNGIPYYRPRTSKLKDESFEELSKTNRNAPIYDTSEATNFPINIDGNTENPTFLGYRLINGFPKFRYSVGNHKITELIEMNPENSGIQRTFTISPPAKTTLNLTPSSLASITTDRGILTPKGLLTLTPKESVQFSVFIKPREKSN
ncbi:MAG: hypothetical protein HOI70_05130, partial [Opitutae bacterium]|nr:hypothetical protein [Opitutae bacterium]